MRILAIETSCDETSAAVVEEINQNIKVLSNITATSLAIHATTGGIIPENAAREQVKYIIPTIAKALNESRSKNNESWEIARDILTEDIDAIAVTAGPGLVGSLLIGVETAKTLSFVFNKPIIEVNHLLAHLFANFIDKPKIEFPFIGLVISGGHTDLLIFKSITQYKWLGGTRDDAAGEALDKIGRLLNLPYPAGPEIEKRAQEFQGSTLKFHSPMIDTPDFEFSFSGLKAETSRFIYDSLAKRGDGHLTERLINEICGAVQAAIFNVVVKKTIRAANLFKTHSIVLGGGVSANQTLFKQFEKTAKSDLPHVKIFAPKKEFATDNAAMIGTYALLNPQVSHRSKLKANPDLYFD